MDQYSTEFVNALNNRDSEALQRIPKSDLHIHGMLGGRYANFLKWSGIEAGDVPLKMKNLEEMNTWLKTNLFPLLSPEGFLFGLGSAFQQAKADGVKVLEMSIDIWFQNYFRSSEDFINTISEIQKNYAPEIDFRPEIGFPREGNIREMFPVIESLIETRFFQSIDLYGLELSNDPKIFKPVFKKAKNLGMKLKCHAGEFGDAESVRYTVDILELDAVQHGISASNSKEVMGWLAKNSITLNVCPTSNVMLSRVDKIENHPVKILFDHGIPVTINSDDIMIFNSSVSEEYLKLAAVGLLSAAELDSIRQLGLSR